MIVRLKGTVLDRDDKSLVVDVNGVGYQVLTLARVREKAQIDKEIILRIYHHVGEDAEDLFGFLEEEDMNMFKLLLTVPSVGVKTALNILEAVPPVTLSQAVAEQDMTLLTKISGVGKKTAQRLVVELKGKLKGPAEKQIPGSLQQEVIEALVSIGYSAAQARSAITGLPKDVATVEEAVRLALQAKPKR